MRTTAHLFLLSLLLLGSWPARGQLAVPWVFHGDFQLGYRSVDVEGREEKYLEDFGLEDGPRLFHLDFDLTPPEEMRSYFDRIAVNLNQLGGDPFETIRVSVQKYARFEIEYDRRKSAYFYEDLILPPELADPLLANAGDLHRFDVERVHDAAEFRLWLTQRAHLHFGFDRILRTGTSTTTLDIERDEFELEQPIDESTSEYVVGFEYQWERASLSIEERIRDYENALEAYLPGYSRGEDPEDPAFLLNYRLSQPYDLSALAHTLRFAAHPTDRLALRLSAIVEQAEMDLEATESLQGTDFSGAPLERTAVGEGRVESDRSLFDLDLSWRMTDRWSLVTGLRYRNHDQQGDLLFDGEESASRWELETTGLEAGVQWVPAGGWTLTGGLRREDRDVRASLGGEAPEKQTTSHTGYFLTADWRLHRDVSIGLELEDSSFDDPFTLASPNDRKVARLSARYGAQRGIQAKATYRWTQLQNDASGWDADTTSWSLSLGYRSPLVSGCVGYTAYSVDRSIDQTVIAPPETELFYAIAYSGDSDLVHANVLWAVWGTVRVGAEARLYDNSGSFPLQRQDLQGWLEVGFGEGYVVRGSYRDIDHDEDRTDWDDYRAGILELSIGRRW